MACQVPGQRGYTECSKSWIYWTLEMSVEVSFRDGTGGHASRRLSFTSALRASVFHIATFYNYDSPSKSSSHATEWGPAKVLPIGPRTC